MSIAAIAIIAIPAPPQMDATLSYPRFVRYRSRPELSVLLPERELYFAQRSITGRLAFVEWIGGVEMIGTEEPLLFLKELLREQSSSPEEDVQSFLDAIAYNWLIAGTDAPAKNYSLLLGQNGVVRLAPLYDLASILPYPSVDVSKVKLAMKIGGEYRLRNIGLRHWQKLAAALRLDDANLIDRIGAMPQAMPDQAAVIQKQIGKRGCRM